MIADLILIKVGGGASINLLGVARDLGSLANPVIVVQGANALAIRLGVEKRVITSVSGYSSVFSDDEAIDLLSMAYAGLANTSLVSALQRFGRNAIGLTGLDGRVVTARRNVGIRTRQGEKTILIRDRSGKPAGVNAALLELLLTAGYTPVLTVPLIDELGYPVNAENDDVVALIREAMNIPRVVQLVEAAGLLRDPDRPDSAFAHLSSAELERLETQATGRFKRKLYALRRLFRGASPWVVLADGRRDHPVTDALAGVGTVIADG